MGRRGNAGMRTKKHLAAKEWTKSGTQTPGVAETRMRISKGVLIPRQWLEIQDLQTSAGRLGFIL